MCTCYPIINRVSELKVHIELTRFVQPEKIEIDANERAVNEKSQYCFFVCTTFDSFLNDLHIKSFSSFYHSIILFRHQFFEPGIHDNNKLACALPFLQHFIQSFVFLIFLHIHPGGYTTGLRNNSCYDLTHDALKFCDFLFETMS